jgi:predicted CopG family antitoxin
MLPFIKRSRTMATHELTINLSDEIFEEIKRYKKVRHKKSTDDAVAELIKYALTLPPYFKDFDWGKAEAEADKEISTGKIKSFNSVEDFITDLKK